MTVMTTSRDSSVLVLVDLQNDFLPGGSLGTKMGNVVAAAVADYVREHGNDYAYIVATKDWHIDPGTHFSDNPDFVDSWPPHCVKSTTGADFGPQIDASEVDEVFYKGEYEAAYSGFEGHASSGETMSAWLKDRNITHLDVVGIATDHCVRATALDALDDGFTVTVFADKTAPVSQERAAESLREIEAAGGRVRGKVPA